MKSYLKYILFLVCTALFWACNEPEDAMPRGDLGDAEAFYGKGVFVVNEGNFDWGVATLSHISLETEKVSNSIFKLRNGTQELGNVAQSMTLLNDTLAYIVINNSARIEIVHTHTMQWLGRIEIEKSSPRYMLPLEGNKAYVTDLYADRFYVVDLKTNTVIKHIPVTGWTEKMVYKDGFVYMTQTRTTFDFEDGGHLLLKIDVSTDKVVDELVLPTGPIDVQLDKNGLIWVLCNGGLIKKEPALVSVETENFSVVNQIDIPSTGFLPARLRINTAGDALYFLHKHVYKFDITATEFPTKPFIDITATNVKNSLFYGLGIHPETDEIYVSDALDYLQDGWVFRYSAQGEEVGRYEVGVIPNEFVFN